MQVSRRRVHLSSTLILAAVFVVLAGCASAPPRSDSAVIARGGQDGADAHPPAGLERVPDAEPRIEPIRIGGPNKPYEALGREYVPLTGDVAFRERGLASWYGRKFQGRPTSSGEPYDMYAMTAAHPTLPIPSYVRVRNPANGRDVIVRINDRGPFHRGRIIDLSYTAALKLDLLRGVAPVEIERVTFDDIRAGLWRRRPTDGATVLARAEPQPAAAVPAPTPPPARLEGAPSATEAAPATPRPLGIGVDADVGTAPSDAQPEAATRAATASSTDAAVPGFWVQLGAFRQRDGAAEFRRRVALELRWLAPALSVFDDAALFRLQAGPYPDLDRARDAAETIRSALQLVPVIVERH